MEHYLWISVDIAHMQLYSTWVMGIFNCYNRDFESGFTIHFYGRNIMGTSWRIFMDSSLFSCHVNQTVNNYWEFGQEYHGDMEIDGIDTLHQTWRGFIPTSGEVCSWENQLVLWRIVQHAVGMTSKGYATGMGNMMIDHWISEQFTL